MLDVVIMHGVVIMNMQCALFCIPYVFEVHQSLSRKILKVYE